MSDDNASSDPTNSPAFSLAEFFKALGSRVVSKVCPDIQVSRPGSNATNEVEETAWSDAEVKAVIERFQKMDPEEFASLVRSTMTAGSQK